MSYAVVSTRSRSDRSPSRRPPRNATVCWLCSEPLRLGERTVLVRHVDLDVHETCYARDEGGRRIVA
jgi:hypothetical protein